MLEIIRHEASKSQAVSESHFSGTEETQVQSARLIFLPLNRNRLPCVESTRAESREFLERFSQDLQLVSLFLGAVSPCPSKSLWMKFVCSLVCLLIQSQGIFDSDFLTLAQFFFPLRFSLLR